jgi:DNA-binding CsgD family transcriptional regulator
MERRLSAQERDVLRFYGSGLSVEEIADRLQISETTVAWIVGNLVSEWGTRRTDELARALAISRRDRFFAQFALPLGVMLVLTIATFVALGATGTLHGPPSSPQATQNASPTTLGSSGPTTATAVPSPTPVASGAQRPPAADGDAPTRVPTFAPPTLPLPTLAPINPTLAPIIPTLPPTLPSPLPTVAPTLSLPPLPTVPPLPTPPRL